MSAQKNRLYVIGDKESGVAFVTLSPLRAALVTLNEIQRFANETNRTVDEVFGNIAEAIQNVIVRNVDPEDLPNDTVVGETIGRLVARGSTVTDAEFCMVADLADGAKWETYRIPFPPIEQALDHLAIGVKGQTVYPTLTEPSALRSARKAKPKKKKKTAKKSKKK